jgi:hypothetical protein
VDLGFLTGVSEQQKWYKVPVQSHNLIDHEFPPKTINLRRFPLFRARRGHEIPVADESTVTGLEVPLAVQSPDLESGRGRRLLKKA